MRWNIALAFLWSISLGCTRNNGLNITGDGGADLAVADSGGGGTGGAGGGGGGGVAMDMAHAPWDIAGVSCSSTGGKCPLSVPCGDVCCARGEWCDANLKCHCGQNGACPMGEYCSGVGAVGQNGCGTFCCGNGVPCPF
jgi:hypothetical protein